MNSAYNLRSILLLSTSITQEKKTMNRTSIRSEGKNAWTVQSARGLIGTLIRGCRGGTVFIRKLKTQNGSPNGKKKYTEGKKSVQTRKNIVLLYPSDLQMSDKKSRRLNAHLHGPVTEPERDKLSLEYDAKECQDGQHKFRPV